MDVLAIEIIDSCINALDVMEPARRDPFSPQYPTEVNEVFQYLYLKNYTDRNYLANMEQGKLAEKDSATLTQDEILTYLTYIHRGERFCDGHIASYIDNGILLALLKSLRHCLTRQ